MVTWLGFHTLDAALLHSLVHQRTKTFTILKKLLPNQSYI